jgi:hypothetical protein
MKMTKFSDWEKMKYSANEEAEAQEDTSGANAELLAQIADLTNKRKTHIKNKEDFEAQILEIDIKLLKLEVDKNNLKEKRKQLAGASEIAKNKRTEGKNYEQ